MLDQAVQLAVEAKDEINLTLNGVVALIVGVLILIRPKLLSYLVAGYLILIGLIDVFDIRI